MSNSFVNPNGWTITHWHPDDDKRGEIPRDAFPVGGPLLIGHSGLGFGLSWLSPAGALVFIQGLGIDGDSLSGSNIAVGFGEVTVQCIVSIQESEGELTGQISEEGSGFPAVGSGTFTAMANPDPGFR
jgi:hypothetical protein